MDFRSGAGSWIYASRSGSPLDSADPAASISRHSDFGKFNFDFARAKNTNTVNPFVAAQPAVAPSGTTSASGRPSCIPRQRGTSSRSVVDTVATATSTEPDDSDPESFWTPSDLGPDMSDGDRSRNFGRQIVYCDDDGDEELAGLDGEVLRSTRDQQSRKTIVAHGAIASVVFLAIFPFGAIAMRLLSVPGLVWIHAAIQSVGYLLFVVAAGIGIWLARKGAHVSRDLFTCGWTSCHVS